jgi:hypothetical protein
LVEATNRRRHPTGQAAGKRGAGAMLLTALGAARAMQLEYMGDPYMTAPGAAAR